MALPLLLDAVERLPAFTRLVNTLPGPGQRIQIAGLPGSSGAVLLAALARQFPGRFFVVVTQGLPDAERWLADLQSLAADLPWRCTRRVRASARRSRTPKSRASVWRRSSAWGEGACAPC